MSLIIFGVFIGFVVYAMIHFLHEWRDAKYRRSQEQHDDG